MVAQNVLIGVVAVLVIAGVATTMIVLPRAPAGQFLNGSPKNIVHYECVNQACVAVSGSGPNLCYSNADCQPKSHLECVGLTCAKVNGSGTDLCSSDSDCSHLECVNQACQRIVGGGMNKCSSDFDCKNASNETHLECIDDTCTTIAGPGTDQCAVPGSYCNSSNSSAWGNGTNVTIGQPLPDLTIPFITVDIKNGTGNNTNYTVTITATIKNIGEKKATNSTASFTISGFPLQEKFTSPLDPDRQTGVKAEYKMIKGTYTVTVITDAKHVVQELNEDNNQNTYTFTV